MICEIFFRNNIAENGDVRSDVGDDVAREVLEQWRSQTSSYIHRCLTTLEV
jgi:hypothetical protein